MASNIVTAGGGCGAATATKSAGLKSWVARQHDKSAALGARTKKRSLDSRAWCDVTSIQAPPARAVAPVVASAPAKNDQRDLQARKEESALSTSLIFTCFNFLKQVLCPQKSMTPFWFQ